MSNWSRVRLKTHKSEELSKKMNVLGPFLFSKVMKSCFKLQLKSQLTISFYFIYLLLIYVIKSELFW